MRSKERLILGVTWGTHDSAAVLFAGGRLVGFVEEERLSGVKHTGAFPKRSIAWLLAEAGAEAADVDVVTSSFRSRGYAIGAARAVGQAMLARGQRRSWARARSYAIVAARCRARTRDLGRSFPRASIVELPHHLCHSAYAHAAAGGGDAAVLSIDSIGEWYSTALVLFDGSGLRLLRRVPDPHSLGYLYGAITEHLGYRRGDEEGTVMALSALGDPERYRLVMERAVSLTTEGFRLDPDLIAPRVFSSAWPRLSQRFIEATFPARRPPALGCRPCRSRCSAAGPHGAVARAPRATRPRRDGCRYPLPHWWRGDELPGGGSGELHRPVRPGLRPACARRRRHLHWGGATGCRLSALRGVRRCPGAGAVGSRAGVLRAGDR